MYADVLMGINFVFNFYLLWLTSLATRSQKPLFRVALGALLGAFYSLTLVLPWQVPGPVNLLFPALMIFAAFFPFSPAEGLRLAAIFYAVTLLSCGALMAFQFLIYRETFAAGTSAFLIPSPSLLPVLISFLAAAALVRLTWVGLNNRRAMESWQGRISIRRGGKEKTLKALVDTGNSLREPVSGAPVVIVYYRELLSLLEGLSPLTEDTPGGRLAQLTQGLSACLDTGIYIIPYKSLGKEGSYLPGFRPEEVEVSVGDTCRILKKGQVVVCLSPDRVSRDHPSLALVHPELICGGGLN